MSQYFFKNKAELVEIFQTTQDGLAKLLLLKYDEGKSSIVANSRLFWFNVSEALHQIER